MIKTVVKIIFVIAVIWSLAFIFKLGNSLALTNDQSIMYDSCVDDAKFHLGLKRAKQYCKCTVIMITNKYSIEEINKDAELSEEQQLKKYGFAADYCNKNANATSKSSSKKIKKKSLNKAYEVYLKCEVRKPFGGVVRKQFFESFGRYVGDIRYFHIYEEKMEHSDHKVKAVWDSTEQTWDDKAHFGYKITKKYIVFRGYRKGFIPLATNGETVVGDAMRIDRETGIMDSFINYPDKKGVYEAKCTKIDFNDLPTVEVKQKF